MEKDSLAYCDDAFAAVTNENALEMLTRGSAPNQRQLARVNQLTQLNVHGNERYGNRLMRARVGLQLLAVLALGLLFLSQG